MAVRRPAAAPNRCGLGGIAVAAARRGATQPDRPRRRHHAVHDRRGIGQGLAGATRRPRRRIVRVRNRSRADISAAPADRRTPPGRAGRCDGRCGRRGNADSRRHRAAGGDARRRTAGSRSGGPDRRCGGVGRVHPAGGPASRPDAGADRRGRRTKRWKSSAAQGFSRRSWTAPECRYTARAIRSPSTPEASTTSPRGCPRWSRRPWRCRFAS